MAQTMTKCRAAAHIIDSHFFQAGYATEEANQVFCDLRRLQRWLDVEVALAKCQAALGIIPTGAAEKISATADLSKLDLTAIRNDIAKTSHSLVPLLKEWQRQTAGQAGQFIHFGATTQDIQDTAQSLELRDIVNIIERELRAIIQGLSDLANQYRDLVMIGRTHGQHALPTTLGLKAAGWLDETLRNYQRLRECKDRLLVSQLFGGVGSMDALSEQGLILLENFSAQLGLRPPLASWHSCRDRSAEFIALLALITGGLARITNEVCQLAKNEIGELNEAFSSGQIGSSTMPHKQNPELCEQVVVLARLTKANALSGFDALINEHERDYRAVRLEWAALTEASVYCCAALAHTKRIIRNLVIDQERISANLAKSALAVSTEALMFLLGKKIGKQHAHDLIYQAAMNSGDLDGLLEALLSSPEVSPYFSAADLQGAVAPANHIGLAGKIIDQVLGQARNCPPPDHSPSTACPLRRAGECRCQPPL